MLLLIHCVYPHFEKSYRKCNFDISDHEMTVNLLKKNYIHEGIPKLQKYRVFCVLAQ